MTRGYLKTEGQLETECQPLTRGYLKTEGQLETECQPLTRGYLKTEGQLETESQTSTQLHRCITQVVDTFKNQTEMYMPVCNRKFVL